MNFRGQVNIDLLRDFHVARGPIISWAVAEK